MHPTSVCPVRNAIASLFSFDKENFSLKGSPTFAKLGQTVLTC